MVVAVIGLFLPWYSVSTQVVIPDSPTMDMVDMVKIDGVNGIQITLPNSQGPTPLGSFTLPFWIFIVVSLVFLVLASIGVAQSRKLGRKYIGRGIRLIVPFILVVVLVAMLGTIIPMLVPSDMVGSAQVTDAVQRISGSPFGGNVAMGITDIPGGRISLSWGFGLGLYLLLISGILLVVAGGLEIGAKTTFFPQKTAEVKTKKEKKKPKQPVETEEQKTE